MLTAQTDITGRRRLLERVSDARRRSDELFNIVRQIPSTNGRFQNVTASSFTWGISRPLTGISSTKTC
jgi:hypothetical protein